MVFNKHKYFDGLDTLRALACLGVLSSHVFIRNSLWHYQIFHPVVVELFLIISGFCLANSLKDNFSVAENMKKRAIRIFPLHVVMLLTFVIMELIKLLVVSTFGIELNNSAFSEGYALQEFLPNLFLLHAWTPWFYQTSFNGPAWTISFLFWNYLLFYLISKYLRRIKLVCFGCISILAFIVLCIDHSDWMNKILTGFSCFYSAVCLYYLVHWAKENVLKIRYEFDLILFISIGAGILYLCTFSYDFAHVGVVLSLLYLSLVFLVAMNRVKFLSNRSCHILHFISRCSYSIYLVQAACIYVFQALVIILSALIGKNLSFVDKGIRWMDFGSAFLNNTCGCLLMIGIVVIGGYVDKYVDSPLKKFCGSFWGRE